jgi:hypothetical protein
MSWWLPFAIIGGAKVASTAIQNKRDKKAKKAADALNENRQRNYYANLRADAERGGFNPLTALRAGGGMGYSDLAGRITQPFLTQSPLAAGINAAANFYSATWKSSHQKEMDKLNKEALRSDIDLSRAQTANLNLQMQQAMAPAILPPLSVNANTKAKDLDTNNVFENGRSTNGLYQPFFSRGLAKINVKGKDYTTSAELKSGWTTVALSDDTMVSLPGEEVEAGWVLLAEGINALDKTFDFNGDRKFEYFAGQPEKYKKSKSKWDLSKIHGVLSDNPFSRRGGYHNNPHFSGVLY